MVALKGGKGLGGLRGGWRGVEVFGGVDGVSGSGVGWWF